MVHLGLSVVFMIGVLQACTANPFVSDASDLAQMYSENELKLARDAGIGDRRLLDPKGFTLEELIKLKELQERTGPMFRLEVMFDFMTNVCKIMDANHKTAANHTRLQQIQLRDLIKLMPIVADDDLAAYIRSTLCAYVSQPDSLETEAQSFGIDGIDVNIYFGIRHFKLRSQRKSGNERVKAAKQLCCVYGNLDKFPFVNSRSFGTFSGLSEKELNEFGEQWTEYETANTSKKLENVCAFLKAKYPDDECEVELVF